MPLDRPHLIAHRGDAARRPENTICALRSALEAGARYVEFDVQLTADGVPVVIHDANLKRTTGADGSVLDRPLSALEGVGAGEPDRFGDAYAGEGIPTVAEAVELLAAWPACGAFVEMKRASIRRFGVEPFADALTAALVPARARCAVISYDARAVAAMRGRGTPQIGWVIDAWTDGVRGAAETLAPRYLFAERSLLPAEPAPLWDGHWAWAVYDIDDPGEALRLHARGVTFIESRAIAGLLADPRLRAGGAA